MASFRAMCWFLIVSVSCFAVKISAAQGNESQCLFSSTECSCVSAQPQPGSKCIVVEKFQTELESTCSMDDCRVVWKCDCLHGTHKCNRKRCGKWTAKAALRPLPSTFSCGREELAADCVEPVSKLSPPSSASSPQSTTSAPLTTVPKETASTTTEQVQATPPVTTTAQATAAPATTSEAIPPPTTATPTTTQVETTTSRAKKTCNPEACPSCFVPSEDCETCIADTSVTTKEAQQCDGCNGVGKDLCPSGTECCNLGSKCRRNSLPSRGLSVTTVAMICSDSCEGSCDSVTARVCAKYVGSPLELDENKNTREYRSEIPAC